ncbi:hypothetical protein KD895_11760 [Enterococcus faecium]|uniref:Integrase core domain protein n=1 Tax=Enterococcus durans TaxID=53345 RepID=A0A377KGB4_9ENTE|nr:Integrase core domain protein [Enterococcus durans]
MTYTHLTTDELVVIESYFKNNQSITKTAQCLGRARLDRLQLTRQKN